MKRMQKILISIAVGVIGFVIFTWWALEWSGVAIVTTQSKDGELRQTHIWYAIDGDEIWLEAGTDVNPWFVDLESNTRVQVNAESSNDSEGLTGSFRAEVVPGVEAAQHVRSLLNKKYGLRDRWIGSFVDSTESVAVRLYPL